MATFVIAVKVVRDENNEPIIFDKQYYTYMSQYNSFINNDKLAIEFRTVEAALSWWETYKKNFPDRIAQVMTFADPDTLSVRRRRTTYNLIEKLTI